jgi:polyvinyl alcohol dehydrogenase (cytochrome)
LRPLLLLVTAAALFAADPPEAAKLYDAHCAYCHDNALPGTRMPPRAALAKMEPAAILRAMESGTMRPQAESLVSAQRLALANWLGSAAAVAAIAPASANNACTAEPNWSPTTKQLNSGGWGFGPRNWRYVPTSAGAFPAAALSNLKLRWAFGFPGVGIVRSQPAILGDRLFIGANDASVFSLAVRTGCQHWTAKLQSPVRSGAAAGLVSGRPLVFLGDAAGFIYALDAATGAQAWKLRPDPHPAALVTGTPQLHNGVLYVPVSSFEEVTGANPRYVCCTFRGSVLALDAATGKQLWKTYTIAEEATDQGKTQRGVARKGPSGAGVWTTPTVDEKTGRLYIATGDNYSDPPTASSDAVLALDMKTGAILWTRQLTAGDAYNVSCGQPNKAACPDADGPDFDIGASPALVDLPRNRRILLVGQKSGMMHGLDPDLDGKIVWQSRAGKGGVLGGIQWGPATDGVKIYAASSDLAFRRGPRGNEPDPEAGGGLTAFRADNGERLWHANPPPCGERRPCSPAQTAAVTAIPGAVFSASMDGHLRAFDPKDGKILWDFDAAREFETVNGVKAKGGAFDVAGPVIAHRMLFAGSGYAQWGGMPGNVLLAFSLD